MKLENLARIVGASLFSVSAAAMAAPEARVGLEMAYDHDTREAPAVQYADACPIRVAVAADARQNKETVGQAMGGALLSGNMSQWVTDGLADLKSFGIKVDLNNVDHPPQEGILIKTSLTRAYTWQVGLKIFSMVALKAQFIGKDGVLQEKYYRAHGDKTNMWGADSEYVTTLNYGLNNLLSVLASDVVSLCKGTQVEKYSYAGPEPVNKK
ncbi:MAG: hypothetical protein FD157_704 [Rhodocyclaceae bacterium]|nr:MAG: hypothetical protein FD157_704 [Rhodocyclaceae bacterium]TND01099.1 MAG: hypothetical protein FD118_2664 [Rhodocyclaceae bacterium]